MTRFERLRAAFDGGAVDRVPISFWQHFPQLDAHPGTLTGATVAYQRRYDLDFVKLMPTGMYSVMDYGVHTRPSADAIGTTLYASGPIAGPGDWERLPAVSPRRGILGDQVQVVRGVRAAIGPGVPVLQTIFSPFTMAAKLTGLSGATLIQTHEPALPAALDRLADDVIVFGQACLDAGTDGFFFATQFAASATLPPGEYERWGVPFDVRVLNALRPRSWGLILHLHGDEPQFDLSDRHPADAVNWHARETTPSLSQGLAATRRGLVGGIARMGSIVSGPAGALIAEARDAIAQTQGRRLVVAPGCVVPTTAPDDHLTALRRAVG